MSGAQLLRARIEEHKSANADEFVCVVARAMQQDRVLSRVLFRPLSHYEHSAFKREGFELFTKECLCIHGADCQCRQAFTVVSAAGAAENDGASSGHLRACRIAETVRAWQQHVLPKSYNDILEFMLSTHALSIEIEGRIRPETRRKLARRGFRVCEKEIRPKICECHHPSRKSTACHCRGRVLTLVYVRC